MATHKMDGDSGPESMREPTNVKRSYKDKEGLCPQEKISNASSGSQQYTIMAPGHPEEELRIITINVRGGLLTKLRENRNFFVGFIKDYDVIMVQETRVGEHRDRKLKGKLQLDLSDFGKQLNGEAYLHRDAKGYLTYFASNQRGVGILINCSHEMTKVSYNEGNYIVVHAKVKGNNFTFASVYYHKKEKEPLLNQLLEDIKHQNSIHVIGGDFNVALDPKLDINFYSPYHKRRRKIFASINWPYVDVWRHLNKEIKEYTYTKRILQKTRLDYFFMKDEHKDLVKKCEIINTDVFDHRPVCLTLRFKV